MVRYREEHNSKRNKTASASGMPPITDMVSVDEGYINMMKQGERAERLTEKTFPRRRREIMRGKKKGMSVGNIIRYYSKLSLSGIRHYPALFEKEHFWKEFQRMVSHA